MRNKYIYICLGIIVIFCCLSTGISHAYEETEKQYIVGFDEETVLFDIRQDSLQLNVLSESELQMYIDAGIVEWYEEDYEVELLDADDFICDNGYSQAQSDEQIWHMSMINVGRAKEILCEGQEINVGIIDSGINSHPALVNNISQGFNYLDSNMDVTDNIGHGTFVGGLIAANENNMGVIGVADEVNIIPLKCFDSNRTTTVSTICQAIKDAVDVYDCDVINMSLGVLNYSKTFETYIRYATDAGVIIVASVGNKGTDVLYYPAAFDKVIGVGSVNSDYEKSDFSQYNSSVDFVAPGENVCSTSNDGAYSTKSGTSFSTPLAAGMIAAMLNVDETLTHDRIVSLMADTATVREDWLDTGQFVRNDEYGYGIINVSACLNLMLEEYTYFISPIDFEESKTQVAIVNNSSEIFNGYLMWGEYTTTGMTNIDWEYVNIPSGESVIADTNITANKIKCFLWRSINDISVIADFRERKVE